MWDAGNVGGWYSFPGNSPASQGDPAGLSVYALDVEGAELARDALNDALHASRGYRPVTIEKTMRGGRAVYELRFLPGRSDCQHKLMAVLLAQDVEIKIAPPPGERRGAGEYVEEEDAIYFMPERSQEWEFQGQNGTWYGGTPAGTLVHELAHGKLEELGLYDDKGELRRLVEPECRNEGYEAGFQATKDGWGDTEAEAVAVDAIFFPDNPRESYIKHRPAPDDASERADPRYGVHGRGESPGGDSPERGTMEPR